MYERERREEEVIEGKEGRQWSGTDEVEKKKRWWLWNGEERRRVTCRSRHSIIHVNYPVSD